MESYHDLTQGRNLGQLHIVINPERFAGLQAFKKGITQTMKELNNIKPISGVEQVFYPGQDQFLNEKRSREEGIEIVDEIYEYLISDVLYNRSYDNKDPFAS